jgi:hypothetical protein
VPHFEVRAGDWIAVENALNKLGNALLGRTTAITFRNITLTDLTASRLVSSDASKMLVSTTAYNWITGTTNRVTVADDGDGTVTLTGPQDIHTAASPTFVGVTLSGLTASQAIMTDADKKIVSVDYLDQAVKTTSGPAFDEVKLTPKASSTGAEGTIFYCSDDNSVYVGTE